MCKLSLNTVSNLYNSLQRAHFCHLLGLGQVGHSPRETSGSAETLDYGPMWSDSQSTYHPNAPLTLPSHPKQSPDIPYMPRNPQCPLCHLYTFWPLSTYTPWQAPIHPWHSLHPLEAPRLPDTPYTPMNPQCPLCHLYPSDPWVLTLPDRPQYTPDTSYTPWKPQCLLTPPTPLWTPNAPYATYTLSGPDYILSLSVPNTPPTPPDGPQHTLILPSFLSLSLCNWLSSQACTVYNIPSVDVKNISAVLWSSANFGNISQNMHSKAPLLHNTKRPTKWSGHGNMGDPHKNFFI